MNNLKKIAIAIAALCLLVGLWLAPKYLNSNTNAFGESKYLYIPTGTNYNQFLTIIKKEAIFKDANAFIKVANGMNLQNNIHPGRYEIKQGMSNYRIAKMLRSSSQKPVKLVINKYRTQKDLVAKICKELEVDESSMTNLLNNDDYLKTYDLNSKTSIGAFMQNTYEFYWNSDAEKVFGKIAKYYKNFWSASNIEKAKALNLTPAQVVTLASIVDEETNKKDEKGNVASVYLNRLKKGMKLQADPTVKFAVGDFSIKRILNKHLTVASPYNTYLNQGLPIGPICNPSESSIKAVLNAPKTDYIFFCAKEDFSGYHNFASNDIEHMANAKKFQAAMDARNIKK